MNKRSTTAVLIGLLTVDFLISIAGAQTSPEPFTSSKCNEFTFDATESYDQEGGKLSYEWNFGDGITSNEPVVTHTYEKAGRYKVTLKITDDEGLSSHSTREVLVNIPPNVTLTGPQRACVNEEVRLDASASYDESQNDLQFSWDFGDGTSDYGKELVRKSYDRGGDYTVRLTVDDQSGMVCSSKAEEHAIHINEPPKADAGPPEILQCVSKEEDFVVTLDASATYDVNADELSYKWDFGDGSLGKGKVVEHKYPDYGVYDAKLMVNDNTNMGCGASIDFVKVQVNEAPKADAGKDITVCPGEEVILDGSNSYANPPGTIVGKWFFGDDLSATGLRARHLYAKPGKYKARLMVESKLNPACPQSSDTITVQVNSPPKVSMKGPGTACVGEEVSFDASSADDPDGDELEYYWSFGDGMIVRGKAKVTHIYELSGTYKVSVIVDDKKGSGCSTATASKEIFVNTAPKADAGINESCCVDVPATFDASASYDPDRDKLSYHWDFGDGSTSKREVTTHTYKKAGTYTVKLRVDDNTDTACSSDTDSFTTEINTTPVPVIEIR